MTDQTTAPAGVVSSTELGHAPRWYCLSADGMATLCVDEEDAKEVAAESWVLYPQNAPYRTAQMVDASAVAAAVAAERERWRVLISGTHIYAGACPDANDWLARDDECPACRSLGTWAPNTGSANTCSNNPDA